MIWLALILSLIPQDDVPDHRVVGWVIPMPVAQDDDYSVDRSRLRLPSDWTS
jgi:hypothetical protein